MGNRALTQAYINVVKNNPKLKKRFKEIILTAPDINADIFKRDIAPLMVKAGNPITLYVSSSDIALKASKKFHNHFRAGDSSQEIIILPGIESIDSTNVNTSFLGHSYFPEEKSVINDIFYIIHKGLRANQRADLNKFSNQNGGIYWKFRQ
jgi:esterase/lipase superfamily enzyme